LLSFSSLPFTEWLTQSLTWIESLGIWGGMAFIGLYIIAAIALLPGSILTLGAGVVFGVLWGTVYVFVGATLGAIAAFLIGRYLVRRWVSQKIANRPNFAAIDQAVAREGFKIVVLTRLSPVFPFNLLNYAFGITGVSLKDYTLGAIGMLPGILLYVYLGSLAGNLARLGTTPPSPNPVLDWSIRLLGLLATLGVTIFVTRLARKAFAETVNQE
jgi:uncharacterized membrane protein YdjX (TVP38/TMEM64 family)